MFGSHDGHVGPENAKVEDLVSIFMHEVFQWALWSLGVIVVKIINVISSVFLGKKVVK